MIVVPLLLGTALAVPFVLFPGAWAIPIAVAGVMAVSTGTSLRQRPQNRRQPVAVGLPVRGEWRAAATPGHRVPSHGTHFLAQTFAIDLAGTDGDRARSLRSNLFGLDRPQRRSAFGRPLLAPAAGTVIRAVDRAPDHRCRDSALGLALRLPEQILRTFMGLRGLVGNHLVLELDDGVHALFAHLQRGSVDVCPGDVVDAGTRLARCGNSGDSTEPHLHFQLMDGPDPWRARGVPLEFGDVALGGDGGSGSARIPGRGDIAAST